MFDVSLFAKRAQEIVAAGKFLYARGWSPATSSNYSARLDDAHAAITVSGRHKGELNVDDIMVVNLAGEAVLSNQRSSAETLLHTYLYQAKPAVGAVLHTHSLAATVLTRHLTGKSALVFNDYELQKAFSGQVTHEHSLTIPIFENTQDIDALAQEADAYLQAHPEAPGYLIRGHGLYTWGETMAVCLRHIEAMEFLLACELEMCRLGHSR